MTRTRSAAALAALLLSVPLAACAPPDEAPPRGDRHVTSGDPGAASPRTAASARDAAAQDPADRPDTSAGDRTSEGGPAEDPVADLLAPLEGLGQPVDPALGTGVDMTDAPVPDELARVARTDPSTLGADSTAALFIAAWSAALTSGDGSTVRALSGPDCGFCRSVADSAETAPLGEDLELITTAWPVTVLEPTAEYPYRVVVLGVEHLVGRAGTAGEAVHLELVTSRRQLVRIGLVWADGAWSVHGVAAEPWDGSDPLAR